MGGSYDLSLFCLARFADKSHADSCDGRRPFFADNFSEAEIIFLAKDGQAKIAGGNFFGAFIRADFFRVHFCGPKKQ